MLWLTVHREQQSPPRLSRLEVQDDWICLELRDGRRVRLPTAWSPALVAASAGDRSRWQLLRGGEAVRWVVLGELLVLQSAEGIHPGTRSSASGGSAPGDVTAPAGGVFRYPG